MSMPGKVRIAGRFGNTPATYGCLAWALLASWAGSAVAQVDWDAEISIDLQRASLRETLAGFAKIGGGELWMEPSVRGEVTLKTDGATTFEILDQICKHHDLQCYWGGRPARLMVDASEGFKGLATSISLALRQADLQQTVQAMSTITEGRVRIEGELEGKVSVEILSAPWPVALTHICQDSGCEVDWSAEPYVVSPRKPAGDRIDHRADQDVDRGVVDTSVASLVASAPSAAWGPLQLEVEGAEPSILRAEPGLDAETWGEAFSRLCERHDCRWQLRYGPPSTLLLTWLDPKVKTKVRLGSETRWEQPRLWSAKELAVRLAQEADMELKVSEAIELRGEVKVRQPEMSWIELADQLCGAVRCRWRAQAAELWLSPTEAPLSLMPTVSVPAVETLLKVTGSGGTGLERTATFDWKRPVYRLSVGSTSKSPEKQSAGALVVTWLPFSSELQWVLPFWLPHGGTPGALSSTRVGSTRTEIPVSLNLELGQHPGRAEKIPESSGTRLSVALAERQNGNWVRESRFTLDAMPGSYLMIAPPGAYDGSATAVIFLGSDPTGRVWVALAEPTEPTEPTGTSQADPLLRVELLTLDRIETRSLVYGDRAYRLSLIPTDPPPG